MKIDELVTALRMVKTKADADAFVEVGIGGTTFVVEIDKVIVDDTGDVRLLLGDIDFDRTGPTGGIIDLKEAEL